jgi:hypothetical protein
VATGPGQAGTFRGKPGILPYKVMNETDKVDLRRRLYLTIMSAASFEECAHKIMKLQLPDEEMPEVVTMVLECCSQERSYQRFYGLLGQRLADINDAVCDPPRSLWLAQCGLPAYLTGAHVGSRCTGEGGFRGELCGAVRADPSA